MSGGRASAPENDGRPKASMHGTEELLGTVATSLRPYGPSSGWFPGSRGADAEYDWPLGELCTSRPQCPSQVARLKPRLGGLR